MKRPPSDALSYKRQHRDNAKPCRSSGAAQPAASAEECQNTSAGVSSSSAAQPAQHVTLKEWSLTPSLVQKPVRREELTHTRPLPLAATVDVFIDDVRFEGQYQGHGKSKIVYLLKDTTVRHKWAGKVLKLCEGTDPEPDLFRRHEDSGLYPRVYAVNRCKEYKNCSVVQPGKRWHAWVSEVAIPLDKWIRGRHLTLDEIRSCIACTIRTMLRAAAHGHIMSDNAMFNFGMLRGEIVIIDAGSYNIGFAQLTKSDFNFKCMRKFWPKLHVLTKDEHFQNIKQTWQYAQSMSQALKEFETLCNRICHESSSAAQPANTLHDRHVPMKGSVAGERANTVLEYKTCPHVHAVLDDINSETLDWLCSNFLWGHLSQYGPSPDGIVRWQTDTSYTAAEKLEELITRTQERRDKSCMSQEHVMTQEELGQALSDWKLCYTEWMRPDTLAKAWHDQLTNQKWHQLLRRAFRSYLFHLSGCYELTLFALATPFSADHLDLFRGCWQRYDGKNGRLAFDKSLALASDRRQQQG